MRESLSLSLLDGASVGVAGMQTSAAFNEAYAAADFFDRNKKTLDSNGNGVVTKAELQAYETSHDGDIHARYLREHMNEFRLSYHSPFEFNRGLNSTDIDLFRVKNDPLHEQHKTELSNIVTDFQSSFKRLDHDRSHSIDCDELETAAKDPSLDAGAKYMVNFMLRNCDTVAGTTTHSITPENADYFPSSLDR